MLFLIYIFSLLYMPITHACVKGLSKTLRFITWFDVLMVVIISVLPVINTWFAFKLMKDYLKIRELILNGYGE